MDRELSVVALLFSAAAAGPLGLCSFPFILKGDLWREKHQLVLLCSSRMDPSGSERPLLNVSTGIMRLLITYEESSV